MRLINQNGNLNMNPANCMFSYGEDTKDEFPDYIIVVNMGAKMMLVGKYGAEENFKRVIRALNDLLEIIEFVDIPTTIKMPFDDDKSIQEFEAVVDAMTDCVAMDTVEKKEKENDTDDEDDDEDEMEIDTSDIPDEILSNPQFRGLLKSMVESDDYDDYDDETKDIFGFTERDRHDFGYDDDSDEDDAVSYEEYIKGRSKNS